MILPPLRYLRPGSLAEAVDALSETPDAAVLAGGQTLITMMKLDLVAPAALVDIHWLDELRGIDLAPDGALVIGAASTYREIAASPLVRLHQPAVATMAAGMVDRQVRNRGTIGGNCCLNDPASNFPPLLTALGATFHSTRAARHADDFFTGTLSTALARDEILRAVELPALPRGTVVEHRHQQVGADSWAIARAVVRLDVTDETITGARVVLGAVLGSPLRLPAIEDALVNGEVPEVADVEVDTVDDYRREMARVQLGRALRAAVART